MKVGKDYGTMRALLLVVALMAVGLLSVAPSASAESCPEKSVDLPDVDLSTNADCTADVVLFADMACLWNQQSKTFAAGPARVTYYYCTGPDPASPSSASACPEQGFETAVLGVDVFLNADCTATVVLFKNIYCVGPWIGKAEETVGPVHVVYYYCQGPNDPA